MVFCLTVFFILYDKTRLCFIYFVTLNTREILKY